MTLLSHVLLTSENKEKENLNFKGEMNQQNIELIDLFSQDLIEVLATIVTNTKLQFIKDNLLNDSQHKFLKNNEIIVKSNIYANESLENKYLEWNNKSKQNSCEFQISQNSYSTRISEKLKISAVKSSRNTINLSKSNSLLSLNQNKWDLSRNLIYLSSSRSQKSKNFLVDRCPTQSQILNVFYSTMRSHFNKATSDNINLSLSPRYRVPSTIHENTVKKQKHRQKKEKW